MKYHLSDMLILEQVSDGPKKPYRIIKGIMSKFEKDYKPDYKPSTGMIYPAIDRMVKAGYIKKVADGYAITPEGDEYRLKNKENYEMMISNFLHNKLFFKNLKKSVKDLIAAINEADKDYIKANQDEIIDEIDEISRKIRKME
ncbi:PadR family transcriptional regulator [Ferroplasma sp.]|uniref:PadR family transcriptional regulator n=1 Tax=Ferroplasma sp. TaxID=2591003 RepID=UPI00307EDB42